MKPGSLGFLFCFVLFLDSFLYFFVVLADLFEIIVKHHRHFEDVSEDFLPKNIFIYRF